MGRILEQIMPQAMLRGRCSGLRMAGRAWPLHSGLLAGLAVQAFFGLIWPAEARAAEGRLPEGLSVEGQSLAGLTAEEAKEQVEGRISLMAGQAVTLEINGESITATAEELGFYWGNPEDVEQAVSRYENSNLLRRYMMAADLQAEPMEIPLKTALQEEAVEEFVYSRCAGMGVAAEDAGIVRVNGAFQITPHITGMAVNLEATVQALLAAAEGGLEQPVAAQGVVEEIQPRITTADLETIQDVLGTFSTDFSSSGAARAANLSAGAGKINGHVLMPGETLSGYECLQPFTAANGYQPAAAYENGQVVDSIGGGVCQIATTLYNAALYAELEITQRQNHSMSVGYVKPSQDAAIAGTYKDIKVTNPYETPVYVEGYTKGRTLVFTIYGRETRPPNRTLSFQSETLSVTPPGAPREVLNTSLAPGARRQVQSAHKGIRSRLWKVVTVDGVEQERTLLSTDTYYASPAVIQIGPSVPAARQETAPPSGTTPSPTGTAQPSTGTTPSLAGTAPPSGTAPSPSGTVPPSAKAQQGAVPSSAEPRPGISLPAASSGPESAPAAEPGADPAQLSAGGSDPREGSTQAPASQPETAPSRPDSAQDDVPSDSRQESGTGGRKPELRIYE